MSAYIDPHIHMISRVTDDYQRMALRGCAPSPSRRSGPGSTAARRTASDDYFRHLTEVEPKRAAQFHIRHYSLAVHQRQGGRERQPVARSHRAHPRVPRQAERPRHRRDRPEQEHAQRGDHLSGARRPGDEDRRADPDPHAAPGGQVQGHADDHRHAQERPADCSPSACASITSRSTRSGSPSTAASGAA